MYTIVILHSPDRSEVLHWEAAPMVQEWNGVEVSLRAGPRERTVHGEAAEPVAVYAPDELNEEEFQELYEAHKAMPELHLHD